MEEEVQRQTNRLKELEKTNKVLEMQSKDDMKKHVELEKKYNTLYENHNSLIEEHNGLISEKEGIAHLVNIYHTKEKEYALTYRENEEYLQMIKHLEETMQIVLNEMEEQKEIFVNMAKQYDIGKTEISKLVQQKTQIQIKNVDLLDELSVLTSKLTKLEEENIRLGRRVSVSNLANEDVELKEKNKEKTSDLKRKYGYEDGNKIAFNAIKRVKQMTEDYITEEKDNSGSSVI